MQLFRLVGREPHAFTRAGIAALLVAAAQMGAVEAQARPNTQTMSCAQAASLVRSKGAVVLDTSANTYDRYVSEVRFCSGPEQLKPEWVATRDAPKCFIGYTCVVPDRNNWIR